MWDRFNANADEQLWYYESLVAVYRERCAGATAEELAEVVAEIRRRHERSTRERA